MAAYSSMRLVRLDKEGSVPVKFLLGKRILITVSGPSDAEEHSTPVSEQ